ncbi:RNA polymerase sigma factor [Pseudodonghicola xiamenensis]|uniref:DNA-directed RNA polymerase sigma-70 factor n=1 Tax=Pseudodonghicola xiamenensis TaxID=337702 RepID=A0A8J3H6K2_9RHOB|nr:RNA polymerase sigma factor [Pseudodonghicola xiamenensis]GHG92993.1 DNA-directed RNA polymerase sigma-70 factor [Pseudodonghicola xiamenensis]
MTDQPQIHFATYLSNRLVLIDYAFRLLGSREAAEDVVQEAYIRFASGPEHMRHPRAYLFRVVRNLALNLRRRDHYERRQLQQEVPDWGLPAALPAPEETVRFGEGVQRVMRGLSRLSEDQRVALRMHRIGGHSMKEIAAHLGVSERTAYRLAQTALAEVSLQLRQEEAESAVE